MFLFFLLYHVVLSGNFYGSEIWHGIFGGLNLGPGVLLEALGIWLGFDFCLGGGGGTRYIPGWGGAACPLIP